MRQEHLQHSAMAGQTDWQADLQAEMLADLQAETLDEHRAAAELRPAQQEMDIAWQARAQAFIFCKLVNRRMLKCNMQQAYRVEGPSLDSNARTPASRIKACWCKCSQSRHCRLKQHGVSGQQVRAVYHLLFLLLIALLLLLLLLLLTLLLLMLLLLALLLLLLLSLLLPMHLCLMLPLLLFCL